MPLVIALDAVAVVVFAAIGRSSHAEGMTLGGVASTAWPFLLGLALGTAVAAGLRLSPRSLAWGALAWAGAVVGGMATRHLVSEGTAPAFVVVATVFLGCCLLGWRLATTTIAHRRSA